MKVLIAGLGNLARTDDGVGIHVLSRLRDMECGCVRIAQVGTAILRSTEALVWADFAVFIDAMQAGGQPGTVYEPQLSELESVPQGTSVHAIDVHSVLELIPVECRPKVVILGVEPESLAHGMILSKSVQCSLDQVERVVREHVSRWLADEA